KPQDRSGTPGEAAAEAAWTIFCASITGEGHVARANRIKEQLLAETRMDGWYIVHQDNQSILYYGMYRSFNDPGHPDTARAQRDRQTIDMLADRQGNRPFKHAFFVSVDSPDPAAPKEWDLVNAPGAYTLQIGAYTGSTLRKQYAVDAVRGLRESGIEAYYYHGETTSSVCVGSFPESAVERGQVVTNAIGDPDQPFLQSTEPLPDALARNLRDPQTNQPIRVIQDAPVVRSPELLALMRQFPEHAVNGEVQMLRLVDQATGRPVLKPADSFVVPIPRRSTAELAPSTEADEIAPLVPKNPARPGEGRLKSIGE
ncbi:MAG: hypothetical protein NZ561_05100, partial [Phycisphaerae bacterium]|nr:hypothetical protein [Phycisphaerae bacterium]